MADDPIKVVCFELSGVLIQSVPGWHEALERAGVEVLPHRIERLLRNPGISEANTLVEMGKAPADQYVRVLAYVSGYKHSEIEAALRNWYTGVAPGIEDLLADLAHHDFRMAVLANTNALFWDGFEKDERYAAIRRHILHRFASYDLKDRKPNLDVYDAVDSAFGVSPDSVLLFDSDPVNADAAKSLGWHSATITPDEPAVLQIAQKLKALGWMEHHPAIATTDDDPGSKTGEAPSAPAVQAEGAQQVTPGRRGAHEKSSVTPTPSNGDRIDAGLIDVHQFRRTAKACGWTPEQLADRYVGGAQQRLSDLEDALSRDANDEVYQLAFAWIVSSSTCGVIGMVDLMQEFREAGQRQQLNGTDMLFQKVQLQHDRIRETLQHL